jgi:cytochrome b561
MALLVFVQVAIGIYASDLPVSIARLKWLSRHKAIGVTVLALVILRLGWRGFSRPPPLPGSMPSWERHTALATHRLLYALLLLAPISGWLYASAAGLSVTWFGWLRVPDLLPKNPEIAPWLKELHEFVVYVLIATVVLHILAALRHAFLRRDGVMGRMLPWAGKEES